MYQDMNQETPEQLAYEAFCNWVEDVEAAQDEIEARGPKFNAFRRYENDEIPF